MNHETESSELNKLQSLHGLSPGKDLDTALLYEGSTSDVFVTPAHAQVAFEKASIAQKNWQEFTAKNSKETPLGAVAYRALNEAKLVSSLASQVIGEEDRSDEIAELEAHLFDYYSPELFAGAVKQKIKSIEALVLPPDLESARALVLEKLDSCIENINASELEIPNHETLDKIGDWLRSQFDDLFEEIDEDGREKYNADEIVEVFQSAVNSTPALRESGWTVRVVEREKVVISTYASRKEIVVPSKRVISKEGLKTLLVHEVFGHALRSAIADENDIPTGQNGTATYARFEESFLIALEQCLEGAYDPKRGINHYIAVGLSVTGKQSKDEIAHLFESMSMLQKTKVSIDDDIRAAALRLTNAQLRRTFTGLTDVDDGIAHRKDIDYLHGLNSSWELLNYIVEKDIVDEAMPWLLSAKFNPFTKLERELVNTYIPMPDELNPYFEKNLT